MEDSKQTTNKHLLGAKLIKTVLDMRYKHNYYDKANTFHKGEVKVNKLFIFSLSGQQFMTPKSEGIFTVLKIFWKNDLSGS